MEDNGIELWLDIKGFENLYQISTFGKVKSLARKYNTRYGKYGFVKEKILKLNKDQLTHYVSITLSLNQKRITKLVHRLVAEAFITNLENKCCVNHIDGNPSNNRLNNLEWSTQKENAIHAYSKNLKRVKRVWNKDEVLDAIERYIESKALMALSPQDWIEQNL